jgi:gas vesicle protein
LRHDEPILLSLSVTWFETLESLIAFFSWLFSSKEFWIGIIGAVIGGLMTLVAAILAQEQSAKDQRKRDLETDRRRIKNLLHAIRAELTVLKTDNLDLLRTKLRERVERQKSGFSQSPLAMPPTKQNHFVVFESNGAALGMIEDKILLAQIVRIYGLIKGLIDNLNTSWDDYQRWRQTLDNDPQKQKIAATLEELEIGTRNWLEVLQKDLDALLQRLEHL